MARWSPWSPWMSRPRRTGAGRPSVTTRWCGENGCPAAGCGCSISARARCAWWTDSTTCPDTYPGARTAELHVVDPETGAVHDLGRIELEARSLAWWSVDGVWHLAYLAVTPPGSVGGLAVFDLTVLAAGAAAEHRNLTADMTVCPTHLVQAADGVPLALFADGLDTDRKSTRLNSSHANISYAVFCLKKQ